MILRLALCDHHEDFAINRGVKYPAPAERSMEILEGIGGVMR
jgi:hypothetical protein